MRPLQNQVTDMAVFGLSVAFLGFVTKMVGDFTGAVMEASPALSMLPQIAGDDYERLAQQAYQVIESIQKAIDETNKAASLKRIERVLGAIDARLLKYEVITGVDDLRETIKDYQEITRAGLTPEEYQEEKETAFEIIMEACEGLDIDEEALEALAAPPEPLPIVDMEQLKRKYGLWAARQAEALCPHNDVACVEREARRLIEVVKYRKGA